ncbi:hypothetical protein C9374_009461 [Naegleria lovaniensis]|uniref:Uncharacterized protein n=1 Tax=Naegleria lovaniensis TaxID=51637 RepID=A0AA88H3C3_NAELO|nr:uncharacterized protein C9374_009461 [Naegleria lovaniensis]KAG2392884.1 hypothetical protein C9374_009461 [Naegleria lovaniensis]
MKIEEFKRTDTTVLLILVKKIIPCGHSSKAFEVLALVLSTLVTVPSTITVLEAHHDRDYLRNKYPEFMKLLTELCTTDRKEQVLVRLLCYCVLTLRNADGEAFILERKERLIALCQERVSKMQGSTPMFFFLLSETVQQAVIEEIYSAMFSEVVGNIGHEDVQGNKTGKSKRKKKKNKNKNKNNGKQEATVLCASETELERSGSVKVEEPPSELKEAEKKFVDPTSNELEIHIQKEEQRPSPSDVGNCGGEVLTKENKNEKDKTRNVEDTEILSSYSYPSYYDELITQAPSQEEFPSPESTIKEAIKDTISDSDSDGKMTLHQQIKVLLEEEKGIREQYQRQVEESEKNIRLMFEAQQQQNSKWQQQMEEKMDQRFREMREQDQKTREQHWAGLVEHLMEQFQKRLDQSEKKILQQLDASEKKTHRIIEDQRRQLLQEFQNQMAKNDHASALLSIEKQHKK